MIKRLALAILLLLLLLLPAGYFATPSLLEWQLQRLAAESQCRLSFGEIERPRWHRWQIREIALTECRQGPLQQLRIKRLDARFRPLQLLSELRLQQLEIDGLDIRLQSQPTASGPAPTPDDLNRILASHWLTLLPLSDARVELRRLWIQTPDRTWRLSGDLNLDTQGIDGRVLLTADAIPPLHINLDWNRDDRLELQLNDRQQRSLYRLQARLDLSGDRLQVKGEDRIDLTPVQDYLKAGAMAALQQQGALAPLSLRGHAEGRWRLDLSPEALFKGHYHELRLEHQLSLTLDAEAPARGLEQLSARMELQMRGSAQQLHWTLPADSQMELTLTRGSQAAPKLPRHWRLETRAPLEGRANLLQMTLLSEQGQLRLRSLPPYADTIEVDLSRVAWRDGQGFGQFAARLEAATLARQQVALKQVQGASRGRFELDSDRLSIKLEPGSYLSAARLAYLESSAKRMNLAIDHPLQIHGDLADGRWQFSPITLNFASDRIAGSGYSSEGVSGHLKIKGGRSEALGLEGSVDLTLYRPAGADGGANGDGRPWRLPDLKLSAPFQWIDPRLDLQLEIQPANSNLKLSGSVYSLLDRGITRGRWQLPPAPLKTLLRELPMLQQALPRDSEIQQGRLQAKGAFTLNAAAHRDDWELTGDAELSELILSRPPWRLLGGRALSQFEADPRQGLQAQGGFWADRIDGPVLLETLSSGLSLSHPPAGQATLNLHHASLRTLGGNVALEPLSIQLERPYARGRLHLGYLDLAQLVALQPKADIQASGRLSGTLPFEITAEGIKVDQGQIESLKPGGLIAYQPPEGSAAGSHPGLELATRLLEEFHYRVLRVQVQYQPDGTLQLDTALKGQNPAWQRGQPVDFNIHIEQNLLTLLRALQYSDRLGEELDRSIQKRTRN